MYCSPLASQVNQGKLCVWEYILISCVSSLIGDCSFNAISGSSSGIICSGGDLLDFWWKLGVIFTCYYLRSTFNKSNCGILNFLLNLRLDIMGLSRLVLSDLDRFFIYFWSTSKAGA